MKKIITIMLALIITIGAVGCQSENERQSMILEATKNKIEYLMVRNETWSQLTDKEWEISKHDDEYINSLIANLEKDLAKFRCTYSEFAD